ncbi:MAG: uracil phosphoribosyltransferase [Candidatus Kapabacteria bacterium]|jgi:uracil phosphoribosyltransferase|nr:uracil phosphoribosyltransferase [Candidatus Kapabacteria bacterium]
MISVLQHPLVQNYIGVLRDKDSDAETFRKAVKKIAMHLAIESMDNLKLKMTTVKTPLEETKCLKISSNVIIVPVLRAGLGLVSAFQEIYPECKIGYIGLKRNEVTFEAEEYYYSMPKINSSDKIIILEIMLATGASTSATLNRLQLEGVEDLTVVSIISAPEGVERIRTEFPDVRIITAALDRGLNENNYILPGLGDAGDRFSGT